MTDLPDRIQSKIMKVEDGCWLWAAGLTGPGYGQIWWRGRMQYAHRVVYEVLVGPLPNPKHLVSDHLCRVRSCVNPRHIEFVTNGENTRRGIGPDIHRARHKAQTHCKWGHEFTKTNTYQRSDGRECKTCKRLRNYEYRQRQKAEATQ